MRLLRLSDMIVSPQSVDGRMIAAMRLLLTLAALPAVYVDAPPSNHPITLTYLVVILYIFHSAVIYFLALRKGPFPRWFQDWAPWIDVGWYTVLIGLSSGTSSIFFFFYFFAILVASFRWGFASGMRVASVSALLFTAVGYVKANTVPEFGLNRFLLRPIFLLVLGYIMAYWGGFEIKLKQRLALLREAGNLSNLRLDIEHTIGMIMERVRVFYQADACLLITYNSKASTYSLRQANSQSEGVVAAAHIVGPKIALPLLAFPSSYVVVYNRSVRWWRRRYRNHITYDLAAMQEGECLEQEVSNAVADLLSTSSFVTIPVSKQKDVISRFYLTSRRRAFDFSEADLLHQLVEHVSPVIEDIQLIDHLASNVAKQERLRISRDIHDSTIQPYIGLRMSLDTLRRRAAPGNPLIAEIDELIKIADNDIAELRRYLNELRDGTTKSDLTLLSAVRREAEKYWNYYGLSVKVEADAEISINHMLAVEALQIVREGLSNIGRHTEARHSVVRLNHRDGHLLLQIENEGTAKGAKFVTFTPRSITERAEALGGSARAERRGDGCTVVSVDIPL